MLIIRCHSRAQHEKRTKAAAEFNQARLPPLGGIRFLVGTLLTIFSEHMHTHLLVNPFFDRF